MTRAWEGDDEAPEEAASAPPATPRADRLAARAALERSVPARLRGALVAGDPLVVVLVVPDAGWCRAVVAEAQALFGPGKRVDADGARPLWTSATRLYVCRDGTERLNGRRDVSLRSLPEFLGTGVSVVAVAADVAQLPEELMAAADHVIEVARLRSADLRRVVRAVTDSSRPVRVDDRLAAACSLEDLAASVRPRSRPGACVARLLGRVEGRSRSVAAAHDVPRLEDLPGNREARDWGLGLVRDVEAWRADPAGTPASVLTRSALLVGPPGTGKTMLCRSLARSAGIPLIETSYADVSTVGGGYLHEVTGALRKAFADAREAALGGACLLLIDEVDAFASRERLADSRNAEWWSALIAALLTLPELGATARAGVVLIGATNHEHAVDPALRRSGRLDRTIRLTLPDLAELGAMVRLHLNGELPDADVASMVRAAPPSTGADAARWVRDARAAARAAGRPLAAADLEAQLLPPETRSPDALLSVARHEAAHAVVSSVLGERTVRHVTLVPVRGYEGRTYVEPLTNFRTRQALEADVVALLAGRAADERSGAVDTGSGGSDSSDLAQATRTLVALRASYGLGDTLAYLGEPDAAFHVIRLDHALRREVEADLRRLYGQAQALVLRHASGIEAVARMLVERRTLSGDEIEGIVGRAAPGDILPSAIAVSGYRNLDLCRDERFARDGLSDRRTMYAT